MANYSPIFYQKRKYRFTAGRTLAGLPLVMNGGNIPLMEQVARPRKALFVLFWIVFWGVPVALLTWFFDWHRTGRVGSIYEILLRFASFMSSGVVGGLWMWRRSKSIGRR